MSAGYHNHSDGGNQDDDDDEDIGALGSILSWDEDEDGGVDNVGVGVGSSSLSDRDSMHSSALPDLVTFNLSKDSSGCSTVGGLGPTLSYLQQLAGGTGNIDPSTLNISIPRTSRRNYDTEHSASTAPSITSASALEMSAAQQQPAPPRPQHSSQPSNPPPLQQPSQQQQQASAQQNNTSIQSVAHTQQLEQQQHQIQQQQQQIQQQQQQIQQQQYHQQQLQQQQHQIQQLVASASANPNGQQQQQQQAQQAAAAAAQAQFAQNAFNFLQQNALLVAQQQQQEARSGKQQGSGSQPQPQTIPSISTPFNIDPNALLRQLQVAQLQQQFNVVQAQAHAQAQAQNAQMRTDQHTKALADASGASAATISRPSQPPTSVRPISEQGQPMSIDVGPATKRARLTSTTSLGTASASASASSLLKPPPAYTQTSRTKPSLSTSTISRAPVVSASDTDGEISLKVSASSTASSASRNTKKSPGLTFTDDFDDIDTSNMSPAERAKANRDRNREHARNTRLRKKAYLEKLKTTVDELCRERDTLVTERAGAANILVEMNNTRTEVLMSFFALRSANEKRRELWASILDESSFICVMPVTPYRSFPASEVQVSKCQRTIIGIDGMMADTASLHVLLNTLVDRSRFPNASIVFRYTLVTEEAVVAGNQMMARWVMTTLNATQCGARMEVAKQGMLCCKFNSAHKIIGIEVMFDVMALMLQLKQAAGSDTFSVIPNTVQTCQRTFDKPMVMILAEEPYTIVQVNKLWEDMTGYKAEEVVGKASCRLLEGEQTDNVAVETLMNEIRFKRSASALVVHYKKTGERFRNFFLAYPLSTDSRITHYLLFSNHVGQVGDVSANEIVPTSDALPTAAATSQPIRLVPQQACTSSSVVAAQSNSLLQNFNAAQKQAAGSNGPATQHQQQQDLTGMPCVVSNPLVTTQLPSLQTSQHSLHDANATKGPAQTD